MVIAAYIQISNANPYLKSYRQQYSIFYKRKSSGALLQGLETSTFINRE
jgi:hypothetical protein